MPEPPVTAYGVGLLAYSQTLDLSAIRRDIGWKAERSLADALRFTLDGGAA